MGLIEDLLRSLEEAVEDQQRRAPGPSAEPAAGRDAVPPRPGSLPPRQQTRAERRQAQQQAQQQAAAMAEEAGESRTKRVVADSEPMTVVDLGQSREHPLAARLRQPQGLRDAIVLAEILRRPSFRRG